MNWFPLIKASIILVLLCSAVAFNAHSQGSRAIVILNGLVVSGEEQFGVSGAHVFIPKAGRGTNTNPYGYFSIKTIIGDSVLITAIGYKRQYFLVPPVDDATLSIIINLKSDTTFLPEVQILPYPTEQLFKEAFLALEIQEDKNVRNMEKNLDRRTIARMAYNTPADGSENYKVYMRNYTQFPQNRHFQPTFSLLNPFAWAQFIQSVQRGDLKRKEWMDD